MEYNHISDLREAANGYLQLIDNYKFGFNEQNKESVDRFHKAISNVNLSEVGKVLSPYNVNQSSIIYEGVVSPLNIIEKLINEIGDNYPTIIEEIDPEVDKVYQFCVEARRVLRVELAKLESRRYIDPTQDDEKAINKLKLYGRGPYGNLAFDDFVKEYIIKDLSPIAVARRLNYLISNCTDNAVKTQLIDYLERTKTSRVQPSRESVDGEFIFHAYIKKAENRIKEHGLDSLLRDVADNKETIVKYLHQVPSDYTHLERFFDIAETYATTPLQKGDTKRLKERFESFKPQVAPSPSADRVDEAITPDSPDFSHMESYTPTIPFDMSALYSFLKDEGVIENFNDKLFADCINQADIKPLWNVTPSKNKLKLALQTLKEYYQSEVEKRKKKNPTWYLKCCESVGLTPQEMSKMTFKPETKVKFQREIKKMISLP